jgi:hypothetical protein
MATLGKTLRAHYEAPLADRQFRKDERFPQSATFTRRGRDRLTFDRVKGGDLRLFLGIGIPEPEIEAESPWWRVHNGAWPDDAPPELNPSDFTLDHALRCSWQFLESCGFAWFDDPLALSPSEWREKHKLLVRDHRLAEVNLSWPTTMPVNERIIKSQRCIPSFQALSALQLRGRFAGVDCIRLDRMPYANALELKKVVEETGLVLEVKIA